MINLKGNYQNYKLYAIDMSGKRMGEIPVNPEKYGLSFIADTASKQGTVLAYELVKR